MSFNPVKTLETVFKPILNPMIFKILKPIREVGKLPGIVIKKFQAVVNGFVNRKETSLRNYVGIGSYYVSKRLLLIAALAVMALVYFLFIQPPAFVNKWFHRVPVLVENTPKAVAYTGNAKLVDEGKRPRYTGDLVDGQFSGKGKLYNEYGTLVYEGDFDKGLKSGSGSLYGDGKLLYKGAFAADLYSGEGTLFREDRKIVYTGAFQNGKYSGAGKLYDEKSTLIYDGAFLEGAYHGPGKQFAASGQLVYEGEFSAGDYNGAGKKYDESGKPVYEGAFLSGRYAGEGTEFYPSGLVKYKGLFAAGTYNGAGELFDDKGVLRFKGTFQNGTLSGAGEAYDEAGKLAYKGEFAGGVYDGIGILYDKDGAVVVKSFFEKGRISLQKFIGLPSKRVEELLGKPTETALLDQPLPDAATSSGEAPAEQGKADTGSVPAAPNKKDDATKGDLTGTTTNVATSSSSAAAGTTAAATNVPSATAAAAGAGAATNTVPGVKFQMNYADLQISFIVEPSKSNPKEAVVSELHVWGSKPLAVLQPLIAAFKDGEKTNAEGFSVLELLSREPGGMTVSRYYRDDYLYSMTFVAGEKMAHELEIVGVERVKH
ncbi:hypothetical protein [Paenibacillus ginsengarvi]|uniref:Antitoxin component YwqK of the YwqJK toxin-antitoxin module n=1 Tax=Paenibacillus ginsengarvi TaxID=400777 RepID=A0A3B0CJV4_9BACL|nr:hypothetical protein [Paenibacillus ginsengarvi]RKN84814.1 hypothetical protein D7M11_12595 [Paenibacillus ginsengarvi]